MAGKGAGLRGNDLVGRLRDRGPEALYLAYGRERWFIDRAIGLLKRALFEGPAGEAPRSLNYDVFAGREAKADPMLTACQTLPMFAQHRLVLVRDAARITDKEWDRFVVYFDDPSDSTCLFIDWGERKPDGRKRWMKELSKKGVVADCRPLYDREIAGFLRHAADARGLDLAPRAASFLGEAVGTDLSALEDAMERLGLFVGERRRITVEDVELAIADTRAHEIWDLTDAVADRSPERALRVLTRVRKQGAAAQQLLAALTRTIRQLWQAKEAMAAGAGRDALARQLGLHPFVAGKVSDAARRFSVQALAGALGSLADAEVATRSGGLKSSLKEWVVLEAVVTALSTDSGV